MSACNIPERYYCETCQRVGLTVSDVPIWWDCGPGRVVPESALVIVRDADGNWPEWAIQAGEWSPYEEEGYLHPPEVVVEILDALAEAAKGTGP